MDEKLLDKVAELLEKYRYDKTMTSHRIAKKIIKEQFIRLEMTVDEAKNFQEKFNEGMKKFNPCEPLKHIQ